MEGVEHVLGLAGLTDEETHVLVADGGAYWGMNWGASTGMAARPAMRAK